MRLVRSLLAGVIVLAACGKSAQHNIAQVTQQQMSSPPSPTSQSPMSSSRQPRRLSLAQLRGSFPVAMGNDHNGQPITWTVDTIQPPQPGFELFARTLGEADYVNLTEDNLEPSPIYVKFMDDAARSACDQALAADATATTRTILRYVSPTDTPATNLAGFNRNLSYLKLRFHGIKTTDEAQLAPLRTLFTQAGQGSPTPVQDGWRAVCVALLTAPEFHIY